MTPTEQNESLIAINTHDFLVAWGLENLRWGAGLVNYLVRLAAVPFVQTLIDFDNRVGREGLGPGSRWLFKRYARALQVSGADCVPRKGPALILSNHPGLTDAIAIFSVIDRADLRIIALDRPFLRALPHVNERLFCLPDDPAGRMHIIRTAAHYLRRGGAILIFPGGHIEPDPLVRAGDAVYALKDWSESIAVFARLAPQTRLVVAIVSGVLSAEAQRNPLTCLRRERKNPEWLGATLQILWKPYRNNTVRLAFSPAMLASDLLAAKANVTQAVVDVARQLIERSVDSGLQELPNLSHALCQVGC